MNSLLYLLVFNLNKMVFGTQLSEQEFIDKYLPRGFILDGHMYTNITNPDTIKSALNFKFRSTDIVIASYPKSGSCFVINEYIRLTYKTLT